MQIEEWKFYRTRDGRKVGPIDYNPESKGDNFPFVSPCGYCRYTTDGSLLTGTPNRGDLIAEWVDEPTEDKPKWGEWEISAGPEYFTPRANMELAKSESGEVIAFRKLIEPVRETVTLIGSNHYGFDHSGYGDEENSHTITFDTIYGKPDCNSIVMEAIGDE